MDIAEDFVIEDGVLVKYEGEDSSVVVPYGIKSIGAFCFAMNKKLTSVLLPDSVTHIGERAFLFCENLSKINIPESVTVIGESTFQYCSSLITLKIPESVTRIGNSAFSSCSHLYKIDIPESVEYIGEMAFKGCKALMDDDLFVVVKGVLYDYFGWQSNIVLPEKISRIDSGAFYNYDILKTIFIPAGVVSVALNTFSFCSRLEAINVDSDNAHYSSVDGVLFNKNKTVLIRYPEKKKDVIYIVPDGVKSISGGAFDNCECLESITIAEGVIEILRYAFSGCKKLSSITLPDSVTSIGVRAFDSCHSIKGIHIPRGVKSIGNFAFCCCKSLTTITFSQGLESMGASVFFYCPQLKNIVLPENTEAFEGTALEVIWNHFLETDYKVYMMCSFLHQFPSLASENNVLNRNLKANKKKIFQWAIENDAAEIAENFLGLYKTIKTDKIDEFDELIEKASETKSLKAFLLSYKEKKFPAEKQEKYQNDKLDKELGFKERTLSDWKKIYNFVVDGENVTIKGYKGKDTNVLIPEKIGKYKVVAIAEDAFSPTAYSIRKEAQEARMNIQTVYIPDSITSIGAGSFLCCQNLTSVTISENVTDIGRRAFSLCPQLSTINLPPNLTELAAGIFWRCESLNSVTIPDGVKSIGERAFSECRALDKIVIPDSVKCIGEGAFNGCEKLAIHTPKGSYPEKYAKENNIPFVVE